MVKKNALIGSIGSFGMAVTLVVLGGGLIGAGPAGPPEGGAEQATGDAQPAKKKKRAPIYDEKVDPRRQIGEARAKARKNNTRVLVQWGANWCGWCYLLHDHFAKNTDVRKKLLYEYEVVLVDVGSFDKNVALAEHYGADFKNQGVPYLTVLDGEGKVLANQETGSLELEGDVKPGHDPKKVLAFLEKHQAPPQTAESVLSDGLARARAENKRVFLHFGAPWCGWCHKLEDWMAHKEVAPVLAKDFIDVKIDIDRMIGGKEVMKRFRPAESGGIPWFAFVDPDGKTIATSEGEKGNLGCPYTPEEITAFKKILRKVTQRITPKEIDLITTKMAPKKVTDTD